MVAGNQRGTAYASVMPQSTATERGSMRKTLIILGGLIIAFVVVTQSQQSKDKPKEEARKIVVSQSSPISGHEMYADYCAVCHGKTGKGDGPVAAALKVPPPDLTVMAKNNNGKYPSDHVYGVMKFGTRASAHGTSDMPIWGPLFRQAGGRGIEELRIHNVSQYLETLQAK